jgi:hypothetical protein
VEITKRIKNAVAAFRKNSVLDTTLGIDPNTFLRYGSRRMPSTWTTPEITDADFYTGYGFAVINKRANRSVVLGKKFLFTEAKEKIVKDANEKGVSIVHPYLKLIRESIDFAERDFWYDISTYLDLEGTYYLMAVRTVTSGRVGNVQRFALLNPYWVRQVINIDGELGGYVENNPYKGVREISKELIIPIRLLNPFDPTKAWSLADAARDSQFTMKQANDYARESINGNINSPGILSSAIELPDDQFDNFVNRVKNHGRGEPLFGNGAGTVSWVDMQTDLDKAALDKINSINRDVLLAISGLSKTGVGVEESGTGREVSRTQKDDFTENAIMPQIENIIDALNLDYRRFYADQYSQNNYVIALDNPLETAHDAEQVDVEIRDSQFALFQTLVDKGYDKDIASKYAKGMIDITDLGEPTNPPKPEPTIPDPTAPPTDPTLPTPPTPPAEPPVPPKKKKNFSLYEGYPIPVVQYLGDLADQITALSEEGSFIFSNDSILDMPAKKKTVHIHHLEETGKSLIGVVDETTFIKLGEFKQNADRATILARLNKRYKNQAVAVKQKIDHMHDDSYDIMKNTAFDKQAQIDGNTQDLLTSAQAAEDSLYNEYSAQISEGVLNPKVDSLESYINSLMLPFAVYFTVMFPVYASHHVQETAKKQNIKDELPIVAMTTEVKDQINLFAKKEATSHMNTLKTDIENALAIIRTKTTNPQTMQQMFAEAYADIRARRSQAIANNAAARIFNLSQYEADLQFLTRAGLVHKAYKVLFSLTGTPCQFCALLIKLTNENPIPFTQAFADLGTTIEADGKELQLNYESIIAGNVHVNCRCSYKLIIE